MASVSPGGIFKPPSETSYSELKYEGFDLYDRNIVILEAAYNIFDLSFSNWSNIRRTISPEQIRDLYQVVADVWHPAIDFVSILPEPKQELRALYLGNIEYQDLLQNVFRYALYADTIFVIDPFQNPNAMTDVYNPLIVPEKWKADTLKIR
jgi:hypothetical protein